VAPTWQRLLEAQSNAWIVGFTATPCRLDGQGLGIAAGGPSDCKIKCAVMDDLVAAGWLSDYRLFLAKTNLDLRSVHALAGDYHQRQLAVAVYRADLTGNAIREYYADRKPALVYCVSVAHSEVTADAFRVAGYRAELPIIERDQRVADFRAGQIDIRTSYEVMGEGLDIPGIRCAILLRPTKGLAVCRQQLGRGLRPAPGKSHLIILDVAGNSLRHSFPNDPIAWTLDGVVDTGVKGEAPCWTCACGCRNYLADDC
jgi:superfamily II DNA or RNA helicase